MSTLRNDIERILNDPNLAAPVPLENALMRAIDEERDRWLAQRFERFSGIDQGISRLALISFVAGELSSTFNGGGAGYGDQWVRYRGHHIARAEKPDGREISFLFRAHDGTEREATFTPSRMATSTEAALLIVDDMDDLLDAVIAAHGVPGDEIPEAEVVETIDSATAARVLDSYATFSMSAAATGQLLHRIRDYYLRAIDRGEIQP